MSSEAETSLTLFVARDYEFWVCILSNKNKTVLYIGMTNDLARGVFEHRSGEFAGALPRGISGDRSSTMSTTAT